MKKRNLSRCGLSPNRLTDERTQEGPSEKNDAPALDGEGATGASVGVMVGELEGFPEVGEVRRGDDAAEEELPVGGHAGPVGGAAGDVVDASLSAEVDEGGRVVLGPVEARRRAAGGGPEDGGVVFFVVVVVVGLCRRVGRGQSAREDAASAIDEEVRRRLPPLVVEADAEGRRRRADVASGEGDVVDAEGSQDRDDDVDAGPDAVDQPKIEVLDQLAEPVALRVVPEEAVVPQDHRRHRADRPGDLIDVVQERHDLRLGRAGHRPSQQAPQRRAHVRRALALADAQVRQVQVQQRRQFAIPLQRRRPGGHRHDVGGARTEQGGRAAHKPPFGPRRSVAAEAPPPTAPR
mmetsp:Transcript_29195/g.94182  ORF Transcript_29195/g.94182 Transcript_29195/m.94182 type:complete len:349 (+) Transcript_29195:60-1106(+)